MRIHVAIATTGRPEIVRKLVDRLALQTRSADGVIVVGAAPPDVDGVAGATPGLEAIVAEKGLCRQRNAALDRLRGRCDVVVFFDDDFLPAHDYLRSLERLLKARPAIVGVTGKLVADGAHTQPIGFEEAAHRLDDLAERPPPTYRECASLYGCNMAFRLEVAGEQRFDENLPLYGRWEDVDFTHRLSRSGKLVCTSQVTGIHLGARSGKTSGKRLGYSQIANIVYLSRKGTLRRWSGEEQLVRNVMANAVRSLWPEPDIDRRGRLAGNLLAIGDLIKGRIDPRRIETL
jgi:GT2 family glycosyltransferase